MAQATTRDLLSGLYRQRDLWQKLLENEGWRLVRQQLVGQVQARKEAVFNRPMSTLDAAFDFAASRGEVAGLELALKWPDIALESVRREIEVTLAELREGEENEAQDGSNN